MFQAFIGPIADLAGSFMQGQINKQKAKATLAQTKAEAEAEIMRTAATHDCKWEIIMAQGTQNSWKDELVTVVILALLLFMLVLPAPPSLLLGLVKSIMKRD